MRFNEITAYMQDYFDSIGFALEDWQKAQIDFQSDFGSIGKNLKRFYEQMSAQVRKGSIS